MTTFTASEVVTKLRERFASGNDVPVPDVRLTRAEFDVIADLLEAREKAVPVMVVNHVSSAEHDLPIGMKLYAHPVSADADRLAEALHSIGERLSSVLCDPFGEVVVRGSDDDRQIIAQALKDLGELAAHSAQAHPPAASVLDIDVMVTRFLGWRLPQDFAPDAGISFKPMPDIYMPHCWPTGTNLFHAGQAKEMILHMLGAQENPNG